MVYKISNKELDLLAAYNRKDGPSHSSRVVKIIAAPVILIGIILIAFGSIYLMKMNMTNQLNDAIADNEVIQLKIDALDKEPYNELHSLETIYSSLEQLDNSLSSLPTLTKQKINYLKADLLNGIVLQTITFDRSSSNLTATLTSENVQNIEKYVTKLRNHVEYQDVIYNGYQRSESEKIDVSGLVGADGNPITVTQPPANYSFTVKITLEKKAGE